MGSGIHQRHWFVDYSCRARRRYQSWIVIVSVVHVTLLSFSYHAIFPPPILQVSVHGQQQEEQDGVLPLLTGDSSDSRDTTIEVSLKLILDKSIPVSVRSHPCAHTQKSKMARQQE